MTDYKSSEDSHLLKRIPITAGEHAGKSYHFCPQCGSRFIGRSNRHTSVCNRCLFGIGKNKRKQDVRNQKANYSKKFKMESQGEA